MAFLVKFDDITNYGFLANSCAGEWNEQLGMVAADFQSITDMNTFRGETADNIKSYIMDIHYNALVTLGEIFNEFSIRFLLYKDGYYNIDSDAHAELDEVTLDNLVTFFTGSSGSFDTEVGEIKDAVSSIADIFPVYAPSSYMVEYDYTDVLARVKELKEAVNAYEQSHVDSDFTALDRMVAALSALIAETKAGRSAGTYVPGSLGDSAAFQELYSAVSDSIAGREAIKDAISEAAQREQERFEELEKEWADQRVKEGVKKGLIATLAIIGGAVAIVATAGAATPLVVAAAVSGTASIAYGASNLYEAGQDIKYGLMGDYSTLAFNPLRDTLFGGNQKAWDTFGTVAGISCTVVTLGASAASSVHAAQSAGTSVGRAVGVFAGKTVVTFGAGIAGNYGGYKVATMLGADQTTAEIVGLVTSVATSTVAGVGAQKLDVKYNLSGYYQQPAASSVKPKDQDPEQVIKERTKDLDTEPHPSKYKQLSAKKRAEIKQKIADRTCTREEYENYIWDKKIQAARKDAVEKFWQKEQVRVQNGEGTRNYTQDMIDDILAGNRPQYEGKTLQGHHAYSVSEYPHLAGKNEVIYPATYREHFQQWHGGNWSNPSSGAPLTPWVPDF